MAEARGISFFKKVQIYKGLILFFLFLSSCQVYNSSSQDEQKYISNETKTVGSVLQNHCGACHSYGQKSFSQLEGQGLVVSGAPMSSLLYTRIRGSGSGVDENMPQAGSSSSDLSSEELLLVKEWITSGGLIFY